MKIIEKLARKTRDIGGSEGVTIAFLGDSVTQGCFELYKKENDRIETEFDKRYSYERYLFDILCTLYPEATVNIINAGISGDTAPRGALRVDRDVIRHQPDLTVVCYGLNDCRSKPESVGNYLSALGTVQERNFKRVQAELKDFCDSHDYRNAYKPLGNAETALPRMRTKLYGEKQE